MFDFKGIFKYFVILAPYGVREPTERTGGSKTEAELILDQ